MEHCQGNDLNIHDCRAFAYLASPYLSCSQHSSRHNHETMSLRMLTRRRCRQCLDGHETPRTQHPMCISRDSRSPRSRARRLLLKRSNPWGPSRNRRQTQQNPRRPDWPSQEDSGRQWAWTRPIELRTRNCQSLQIPRGRLTSKNTTPSWLTGWISWVSCHFARPRWTLWPHLTMLLPRPRSFDTFDPHERAELPLHTRPWQTFEPKANIRPIAPRRCRERTTTAATSTAEAHRATPVRTCYARHDPRRVGKRGAIQRGRRWRTRKTAPPKTQLANNRFYVERVALCRSATWTDTRRME